MPIDDILSQPSNQEYKKNIAEIFEGLFGDKNVEKKSDLTDEEVKTLSLIEMFNDALKDELGLDKDDKTFYDVFVDRFLRLKVSQNRRGRKEVVEVLKEATPMIDREDEKRKGLLRRLF